ncbi:DUF559 domain-containing protein [Flavipsychrobacter stenotrophus]|nr:DUF559 domain-containing protein [Flavipsychrobacter stenotrophus]
MGRIPINIIKYTEEDTLYKKAQTNFQLVIIDDLKGWNRCYTSNLQELTNFRNEISVVIESLSLSENLNISVELAKRIEKTNLNDEICISCTHKKSRSCVTCLEELQSPLERKLYAKLLDAKVYFEVQYPMNKVGKKASLIDDTQNDLRLKYRDLLTQVDFFLPNKNPICVYTDGHTYHERTEEQAKRDRSIDRKLQELGFVVLRFTGKEINESLSMVVNQVMKLVEMKN